MTRIIHFIAPTALTLAVLSSSLLSGCSTYNNDHGLLEKPSFASVAFDEQAFRQDIKTLASDEFEGRAPTTKGETLTINYLSKAFEEMGLVGANQGSFLQAVPMVSYTASDEQSVSLAGLEMKHKEDVVLGSRNDINRVDIQNAPLVFVGYGINAPEYKWNDYQDIDMKGKIAVILVNDPGFANPESGKFNGKTMTYYGRWTYKYEEAARQGAIGAIIVHQTAPASYPWSVVRNSWTGPQQDLANKQSDSTSLDIAKPLLVEGWVSLEAAKRMFAQSQLDFDALANRAAIQSTQVDLHQTADISFATKADYANSYNVVATLPGKKAADEHVIFTAHWDHLGKDDKLTGDKIYNGALDNATGTAGILAIARQFAKNARIGNSLKRSVTFIATTGEEQGLLGSRHYVAQPLFPIDKTVAVINIDASNVYGETKDFTIVGKGKSELEQVIVAAANAQGRYSTAESRPESGGFFRSDHFSFAKLGVPAIYARGGSQPKDDNTAEYKAMMKQKMKGCYHNTCDDYKADWDLSGALEDMTLFYQTANIIANGTEWPGYYKGTEFNHLRPATSVRPVIQDQAATMQGAK